MRTVALPQDKAIPLIQSLEQKTIPSSTAILIIDMQNDFCSDKGILSSMWGLRLGAMQSLIQKLQKFLTVVRDRNVRVIFIKTARGPGDISEPMEELMARHGGREYPCTKGSWGAELVDGIRPEPGESVIEKKRYSAFLGTDLDKILKKKGVRTLILTGVVTEVCVETTARDAFMLDYHVLVVKELTASPYKVSYKASLANIQRYFGVVVSSEELFQVWGSNPIKLQE